MEKTQITKGDMYYADLGTNVGSEQNGTRPVVIIQNDVGNFKGGIINVCLRTVQRKRRIVK